jgi:hypothetical protein
LRKSRIVTVSIAAMVSPVIRPSTPTRNRNVER